MKMPRADEAFVEPAKVWEYLLNRQHPKGGSKARFFRNRGFQHNSSPGLDTALLALTHNEVDGPPKETKHGIKYRVTGLIETPDAKGARVRTVWIVEDGKPPRLVTALPESP